MKVIPLSYSQTNWPDFIELANNVVGHSPTRSLDSANIRPGDPFSFIASLEELINEGTYPRDALLNAGHTLRHVHVSFMAELSEYEIMDCRNIPFLSISEIKGKEPIGRNENFDYLIIISGTLLEWQYSIPLLLRNKTKQKELFSKIYVWFKKMNLKELFDHYTEEPTSDGFFYLKKK